MDATSPQSRRQRSRIACDPCRERKRRCSGDQPCDLCRGYGYTCSFRLQPRRPRRDGRQKRKPELPSKPSPEVLQNDPSDKAAEKQPAAFVATSESNSGPAFVHAFALAVDPSNAPPFRMLGWNVFLGERNRKTLAQPLGVPEILSLIEMQNLMNVYFDRLDPCYGFLDRADIEKRIARRWPDGPVTMDDAILCGIAAIGCLFCSAQAIDTEALLTELLKSLLDLVMSEPATVDIATAWILRTVYLRLTAKPDEGWMASCITLHTIDSARLQCEPDPNDHFQQIQHECSPDIRRRMFGVAQHLNVWMSFDLARSRVRLQNASSLPPSTRPNDYTTELLELLPLSEKLDPSANLDGDELIELLGDVLDRVHTQPPSVMAQCNLMLCIFRRLHGLKHDIPSDVLSKVLELIEKGTRLAQDLITAGSPWHQLANVPFQSICALLVIDTTQSLALLQPMLSCMENLNQVYATQATSEILQVARTLINLHQKRRRSDMQKQSDMLELYPTSVPSLNLDVIDANFEQAVLDLSWFDDLAADPVEIAYSGG